MWLTYLQNDSQYNLRYFCDMRREVAGNISFPSLSRLHACIVDSGSTLQACWPSSKALQWLIVACGACSHSTEQYPRQCQWLLCSYISGM